MVESDVGTLETVIPQSCPTRGHGCWCINAPPTPVRHWLPPRPPGDMNSQAHPAFCAGSHSPRAAGQQRDKGDWLLGVKAQQHQDQYAKNWQGFRGDLVRNLTGSAMFPGTQVQEELTWVNSRVRRVCSTLQVTYPFSKLSTNLYSQQQCHI